MQSGYCEPNNTFHQNCFVALCWPRSIYPAIFCPFSLSNYTITATHLQIRKTRDSILSLHFRWPFFVPLWVSSPRHVCLRHTAFLSSSVYPYLPRSAFSGNFRMRRWLVRFFSFRVKFWIHRETRYKLRQVIQFLQRNQPESPKILQNAFPQSHTLFPCYSAPDERTCTS